MSLSTLSMFYYGHEVTASNCYIDFDEGGSELTAVLTLGTYSLTDYLVEVKRAMEAVGALTYTVSVARATRLITISAGSNFSLLTTSGTNALFSAYSMIGFSGSNKTGANNYTGSAASGSSYTPQFKLQNYVASTDKKKYFEGVASRSVTGITEFVHFGLESMVEFNIRFATDIPQPSSGPITSNASGVANLRSFMNYIIKKAPFEFMPSSSVPGTFETLILESTKADSKGMGYELEEQYSKNLPGYFDSGLLTARVIT